MIGPMQIGLFIPCYIDQFYPQVGMATVEVLERHGVAVDYPTAQTCCGQPLANTGCQADARPLAQAFVRIFDKYEYVVCPSGSCTAMVRHHYEQYFPGDKEFEKFSHRVFELCEFLTDVLRVERIEGSFPHRVGLHQSCHGLRELRLGKSSELVAAPFSKAHKLLGTLEGIEFSDLSRPDECCGFGGTFAVAEEAVSCMMGRDRIFDHEKAGTEVLTALDMSCLMHLDGLIRRDGKQMRVMHVAEILAGRKL
jgi:L-lactate dehydrogenase complex protein LldE